MKSETYKEESGFRRFRNALKGLTFEEKIDYIFSYYWGTILLMILIPVALVIILVSVFKDRPDVIFSGNCCNVTLTAEGQSYLINEWSTFLNMEPGTLQLNLDYAETGGVEMGYEIDGGVQVIAAVASNDLDYILCDEVAMEYFSVQKAYLPVDQILGEETLDVWSSQIYRYYDEEDGTTYATALDVSDIPFVQDCVPEGGQVYFMFANKEEADVERLQLFLSHLTAWGQE